MTIGELRKHLFCAAREELLGVSTMEMMRLHSEDDRVIAAAIGEVRRRADALGAAFRIITAIEARPQIAAQLGLTPDALA